MRQKKLRVVYWRRLFFAVRYGFVYVQAIGVHPREREQWIARVLRQIQPTVVDDAAAVAAGEDTYTVVIGDLGYGEQLGQITYVGRADVPQAHVDRDPTIRRNMSHSTYPLRSENWWLDDGKMQ